MPENALLSHDLFEGLYARTALVTDVEVVDDYPSSVLAHARRQHRWVRGDWQILWWLFPFVPSRAGLAAQPPAADRALEDSRQPAAQPDAAGDAAAAPAGWTVLPGRPLVWTAIGAGGARPAARRSRLAGSLAGRAADSRGAASCARRSRISNRCGARRRCSWRSSRTRPTRWLHAIGVTLVRLGVTRRRLLEWETAAASAARGGAAAAARVSSPEMSASPLLALATLRRSSPLRPAGRVARRGAGARALGGGAADRVRAQPPGADAPRGARRGRSRVPARGRAQDLAVLRHVRRRRGPRLPPDNVQIGPDLTVAHRTSPTNIGMALLATLAAHDLGFIDTDELRRPDRRDAHHRREPGTLRGPPAELVRHAHAGAAAAGLRLHGRQRQPRRRAADAVGRLAASCALGISRARAAALFDAMNFRFLYDPQAAAVRHRLPPRRRRGPGPARSVVLRPARLRSAPGQLPRDRQGRRARDRTGSTSDGRSPASAARRCCCRGAPRCSST